MENLLNNWFALHVKTGEEDRVKQRLEYRLSEDVAVVVPKRKLRIRRLGRWSEMIRPLFPGYVLVNGNFSIHEYYKTKRVPGLYKVLRSGFEPVRVPIDEIDFIVKFFRDGDTLDISNAFCENDKIVIIDGPLSELQGNIIKCDKRKGRVKVRINFLGEERLVDLGVNLIIKDKR